MRTVALNMDFISTAQWNHLSGMLFHCSESRLGEDGQQEILQHSFDNITEEKKDWHVLIESRYWLMQSCTKEQGKIKAKKSNRF